MRSVYGIATMLAAAQTSNALDWSDIKNAVSQINFSELAHAYLDGSIDIYDMNPFKDFKVTTRHTVNAKLAKNKHKVKPLNSHQRSRVIEAHHSMLG